MIAGEQVDAVGHFVLGRVGKAKGRACADDACVEQVREISVECDPAEADNHTDPG